MIGDFAAFARERVIIMAAPNGARRSQVDHPALPVKAGELADTAIALRDTGVSVLHLHVRDEAGKHTLDPRRYREALDAIRDRVGDDLILQVTTEAVGRYSPDEQMAVVRQLRPEAVSLALRELLPDAANEGPAAEFFAWLGEARIWPQYILYSEDDVRRFDELRRRGIFADQAPFALFVLGSYAEATPGRIEDLDRLLSAADARQFPWAVCAFGADEHAVMLAAVARGGHVRIGFENNLWLADGTPAPDNAALVRQFTATLGKTSRQAATAAEIRQGV